MLGLGPGTHKINTRRVSDLDGSESGRFDDRLRHFSLVAVVSSDSSRETEVDGIGLSTK